MAHCRDRVDERITANRLGGPFEDFPRRPAQHVTLDVVGERLAEAGGAGVVGLHQHVAGRGQQMRVPARREGVAVHAVRSAVRGDEERVFLRAIEIGREVDHAVDPLAVLRGEPEVLRLRQIERVEHRAVRVGQQRVRAGCRIDADDLARLPARHEGADQRRARHRRRRRSCPSFTSNSRTGAPPASGTLIELREAGVLRVEQHGRAVGRDAEAADAAIEVRGQHARRAGRERPGDRRQPRQVVELRPLDVLLVPRDERLAVGRERRIAERRARRRETRRLGAERHDGRAPTARSRASSRRGWRPR